MPDQNVQPRPGFSVMAKAIGPACNLDCAYCFYLEKEKLFAGHASRVMPDAILEAFIRQYIDAQQTPRVTFVWQGGEPTLLGIDYFRKIVRLQKKYAGGKQIENAFQTNGVLLNDDWAAFFAENRFLLGVSIDGPQKLHDIYRVNKAGAPTFEQVLSGIAVLRAHKVEFNTLTVVHRKNADHADEVYHFLKDIGSRYMQFIPLVHRQSDVPDADISAWSVRPHQFGDFLCTLFDEWVRHDIGHYFIQTFDVAMESWMGLAQSVCVWRPTCGDAMVIEHTGDIYACDHYVSPENRLGSLADTPLLSLVNAASQQRFGRNKADTLPRQCRDCDVLFACNGECPRNRFATTAQGEPGLNYLCPAYKKFFHHIAPYMECMAAELRAGRNPATIMQHLQMPHSKQPTATGRNDPCPCGSGKKYKKCCGSSR